MSVYLQPIITGFLVCLVLWQMLFIPTMVYQYRKYGKQSPQRTLYLAMFLLYIVCAYFLVILPLPERSEVTKTYTEMMQLVPFMFVKDFFDALPKIIAGFPRTLLHGTITQPIFNIILTIPFGMFMRVYYKKSFKQTFLLSLLLALFFELTQLSGLYGIYSGPYRLFDVDDLFLNTLGGLIGYAIGPIINVLFPEKISVDDVYHASDVTYIRRAIAYTIDLTIVRFVSGFFGNFTPIAFVILSYLYFVGVKENTLGQKIVKIKVVSTRGELTHMQRFIRHTWVLILFSIIPWLLSNSFNWMTGDSTLEIMWPFVYLFGYMGLYGFIAIHAWYMRRHSHRRLFYETLSHTEMIVLER